MKHYIFTTPDGYTVTPDDEAVDNLQVLGSASGETMAEAWQNLIAEYPSIMTGGWENVAGIEIHKESESWFTIDKGED
jgi:hypothetical protein